MKTLAPSILIVAAATLAPFSTAVADTLTWGLAGNGNWDTTSENWSGSSTTWVDGNDAVFDSATGYTVTLTEAVAPTSVTINNNGAWALSGLNYLSASATITKSGTGTLNLNNSADGWAGDVVLNGGQLTVINGMLGPNYATTVATGTITLNSGTRLAIWGSAAPGHLNKNVVLNGGQIFWQSGDNARFYGTFQGSGDLNANYAAGSFGNVLTVVRNATGTTQSLNNTYTGNTNIANNGISFSGYSATNFTPFGTNTSATVDISATSYNSNITFSPGSGATNSTFYIAQALNLTASSGRTVALYSIDGTLHFSGDIAINAAGTVIFQTQYNGKNIYLDGIVSGSGEVTIRDVNGSYGAGWVSLTNNANSFSGTYTVTNPNNNLGQQYGALSLEADNAAADAKVALANGHLRIATATATVAGLSGANALSTVYNADASARAFTVNTTEDSTFSGTLGNNTANADKFSFAKDGTGVLTLSAASTFTGMTTVAGGTLVVDHANALGTGDIIVGASGTLQLGATAGVELSGVTSLSVIGTLVFTDADSKIVLSGDYILINAVFDLNNNYNVVGTYQLFDLDGTGSGAVSFINVDSGFHYSFDQGWLTVSSVPEPGTYALFSGIVALGFVALRRRHHRS